MERDIAEQLMATLQRLEHPFNEATILIGSVTDEAERQQHLRGLGELRTTIAWYHGVMLKLSHARVRFAIGRTRRAKARLRLLEKTARGAKPA